MLKKLHLPLHNHILQGAAILTGTQLGASLTGLLRDRLLAKTFPDLTVVDAYIAAFRPADLIFQMFIMSAVGTILVPLLASHRAHGDEKETAKLLGAAFGTGGLFFIAIAIPTAIFFPYIAPWIVDFKGEQLALYTTFCRIVLLSDLLMVFGNIAGQYLITIERYWVYGLTPIVYSLGTIGGTLFLIPYLGAYGPIVGTAIGTFLYAAWRLFAVHKSGFQLRMGVWHENIKDLGWKMLPRMGALGMLQVQLLMFDAFASRLSLGSITINAYARNFQSVVVGAIGIALAQAVFSPMSHASAIQEWKTYHRYLKRGLFWIVVLTFPASVILMAASPLAASIVHLSHVVTTFTIVLWLYALSIPTESANHLLLRAHYALHDTRLPAIASSCSSILMVLVTGMLLSPFGILALPFGFLIGQSLQTIILWWKIPEQTPSPLGNRGSLT